MNATASNGSILLISNDGKLLDALESSDKSNSVFTVHSQFEEAISDTLLLNKSCTTIIDLNVFTDSNAQYRREQIIRFNIADPTQAILLIGSQDELGQILDSETQPLVFRAFSKPIHPGQIALSFKSAANHHKKLSDKLASGKLQHPKLTKNTDIAQDKQTLTNKSILFAALGLIAVGIFGWLLFFSNKDASTPNNTEPEQLAVSLDQGIENDFIKDESNNFTISATAQRLAELNQAGELAITENRLTKPANNNALLYFNQVLSTDAYNSRAYSGKKQVAMQLRESIKSLINQSKFEESIDVLNAIQSIEPLNHNNDQLRSLLNNSLDSYIQNVRDHGSPSEVEHTTTMLGKLESSFMRDTNASEVLRRQSELISDIDQALDSDQLMPPIKGNAFTLVYSAISNNTVSNNHLSSRVTALSSRLIQRAQNDLASGRLSDAKTILEYLSKLDSNISQLSELTKAIEKSEVNKNKQLQIASTQTASISKKSINAKVESSSPTIRPIKGLSRPSPKYPTRASARGIEGNIKLSFRVDTSGRTYDIRVLDSSSKGTFDAASIKAIKRWRFKPAFDLAKNIAIDNGPVNITLQFNLD